MEISGENGETSNSNRKDTITTSNFLRAQYRIENDPSTASRGSSQQLAALSPAIRRTDEGTRYWCKELKCYTLCKF